MTRLILTQLRVAFGLSKLLQPGRRWRTVGLAALLVVALSPSYAGYIAVLHRSYEALAPLGATMQDTVLASSYSMVQLTVLLVGIPVVYATLFQARDLSILLPLPLRPVQIVAAKLATVYVIELLVGAALFVPAVVLHVMVAGGGASLVARCALALVFLPVIPVALSTLVSLMLSSIPVIGRSRWFWYMAITLALLGATISYTVVSSTTASMGATELAEARRQQIEMNGRVLPGAVLALRAITTPGLQGWAYQGLSLLAVMAYVAATLVAAQWWYIGPVVRGTAAARRRARRAESARVRSFLGSHMRKEVATTLKDPAVAMNALGGYIALPLMAITYGLIKWQTRGKVDITGQILHAVGSADISGAMAYVGAGVGLGLASFSAMSSLFSASYSKDGKRLWIEKSLPVTPFEVMLSKLVLGVALVSALNLVTLVAIELVLPLSVGAWLYAFLLSELLVVSCAASGLMVDCLRPKLDWQDTVQAVKQNVNVVLGMGLSSLLVGANVGLLVLLHRAHAPQAGVYAATLALNVVLAALVLAAARRASRALERVVV